MVGIFHAFLNLFFESSFELFLCRKVVLFLIPLFYDSQQLVLGVFLFAVIAIPL